ncbi:MAG: FtsX-like permease family protein [Rhodothermales bacterium]|nr:FtsX-like permease family protein [Rhodothermales bacterium]
MRILTLIRDTQGKSHVEDIDFELVTAIHFSSIFTERQGDSRYVWLLSAIALIVLLIACANYMNLATARAMNRRREVGLRKVVGAHRTQLMRQFLVEAIVLAALALPVAVLFLLAALPTFNALAETDVRLLTADFVKLVAIAAVLAVPIAYYAAKRWLEAFAFHIDIAPTPFLAAGIVALLVAMATTGFQAYRATRTDPVESLRHE